jgi:hypothetical protein
MLTSRVPIDQLARESPDRLVGSVLLAPAVLEGRTLPKGLRLAAEDVTAIIRSASIGSLTAPLRLGWPEDGDIHEDEAALRLARAAAGPGVTVGPPRQSRVDLVARWPGVLRVNVAGLAGLNRVDPLEVFTLFHGQAVSADQVVGAAKVAPHLLPARVVEAGEAIARTEGPLLSVAPYQALAVAAIAVEPLSPTALERFDRAARTKVSALGGRFIGTTLVDEADPAEATARATEVLRSLAVTRRVPLVLVGGVSAGDPLSPFYSSLEMLGGVVRRRGVPAHPGSMIWLAELDATNLLGLPQCGMFSMATAADLVLPRLLTGERITPETLADLGHGGLLGREMRFRFPPYARDLDAPQG